MRMVLAHRPLPLRLSRRRRPNSSQSMPGGTAASARRTRLSRARARKTCGSYHRRLHRPGGALPRLENRHLALRWCRRRPRRPDPLAQCPKRALTASSTRPFERKHPGPPVQQVHGRQAGARTPCGERKHAPHRPPIFARRGSERLAALRALRAVGTGSTGVTRAISDTIARRGDLWNGIKSASAVWAYVAKLIDDPGATLNFDAPVEEAKAA
jgi:hypothetical protein